MSKSFFFDKDKITTLSHAHADVIDERQVQDEKWGEQNHNPFIWLSILMEEVGEFSTDILDSNFLTEAERIELLKKARKEMVQVAAVAIAIIESMDRNELLKEGA